MPLNFLSSLRITNGKPHRPILLLALAKTIGDNLLHSPRFKPMDEELLSNYDLLWRAVTGEKNKGIHYPFFALRTSEFWRLEAKPGMEDYMRTSDSMRSFTELCNTVACAELNPELFRMLQNPIQNKRFVDEVHTRFLSNQLPVEMRTLEELRFQREEESLANLLLEPEDFNRKIVLKEAETGEIYVRNADFRRHVPRIYDYRCAITGRGLRYGNSMSVEACHIEPFSVRQLCTIYNGISLSPELHKLFDQHYIAIDSDYRVVFSTDIRDISETPYYSQFHGKQLRLPGNEKYWPSQQLLKSHRDELK